MSPLYSESFLALFSRSRAGELFLDGKHFRCGGPWVSVADAQLCHGSTKTAMDMDGCVDGWVGGWMEGWTDGRTDGRADCPGKITERPAADLPVRAGPCFGSRQWYQQTECDLQGDKTASSFVVLLK